MNIRCKLHKLALALPLAIQGSGGLLPSVLGRGTILRGLCSGSVKSQASSNVQKKEARGSKEANSKSWNEASCVIAVAPMNNSKPYSLGYLMVERSGTGRVMPGNWVFPGGNADPSDADFKWIPLFKDVQKIDILNGQFFEDGAKIPEIYATADNSEQIIPKEITLRITAVRELFEEAGILLCKPRTVDPVKHIQDGMLHYEFPELENKEKLQEWQKRVRKDSTSFLQLCKLLDCVPDINALYDWSNWLTPTTFKPKSRFDTMYYMVILPRMPRVVIDGNEAVKAQWTSPTPILADHSNGRTKLMPPQLYEFTRLKPLTKISDLQERFKLRKQLGIERYFPVFRKTVDGALILLPGDDLYPSSPDFVGTEPPIQEIDGTLHQLKQKSKNLHRGIVDADGTLTGFEINVERHGNIY